MPKIAMPPAPPSGRITSREDLGRLIRYARMQAGLTAEEAAMAIGIAKATLLRVEQGNGGLQFDNVLKIFDGLGISLSALPARHDGERDLAWPNS
jgi:transcriptional regulator with XRE-family HTH domain